MKSGVDQILGEKWVKKLKNKINDRIKENQKNWNWVSLRQVAL